LIPIDTVYYLADDTDTFGKHEEVTYKLKKEQKGAQENCSTFVPIRKLTDNWFRYEVLACSNISKVNKSYQQPCRDIKL
jgi:hypothetical protein